MLTPELFISADKEGRRGYFVIAHRDFQRYPKFILDLFRHCIVIDISHDICGQAIKYLCISHLFDPVEIGYWAPEYTIEAVHDDLGNTKWMFMKTESKQG